MLATKLTKEEQDYVSNLLRLILEDLGRNPETAIRDSVFDLCKSFGRDYGYIRRCVRGNSWQSPVARYLRRRFWDRREVEAVRLTTDGAAVVMLLTNEEKLKAKLPESVVEFERAFQAGIHGWLE